MFNSVNSIGNAPLPFPAWRNATKNANGLNYRETEIFNQIRDKVSSSLGVPVKINEGSTSDCGQFTIALIGAGGASASGTRQPFMITRNMLAQMAEDENKYNHFMSMIQNQMQQTISLENSLRANLHQADQEDADRRSQQIRNSMLCTFDFWNENRNESRSWLQAAQGNNRQVLAGRYESMLAGNL